MLERPAVSDDALRACLHDGWGLAARELRFLPLGADAGTAVFRARCDDGSYLLKLRRGVFDPVSVEVPALLRASGIGQVIAPLPARDGALWSCLGADVAILFSFVEGRDAIARPLGLTQLRELGATLRRIHDCPLPEPLRARIPRETFAGRSRSQVCALLRSLDGSPAGDALAGRALALLRAHRAEIDALVARAEARAAVLRERASAPVLCHADLHAWNLLVEEDGRFHVIDWDTVTLAPRERDLMLPGSGIGGVWSAPAEVDAFLAGYGTATIDPLAIAWFREERIIEDIAVDCALLLDPTAGADDRARALGFLASNLGPDGLIAFTRRHDPTASSW